MRYLFFITSLLLLTQCVKSSDGENIFGDEKSRQISIRLIKELGGFERWTQINYVRIDSKIKEFGNDYKTELIFKTDGSEFFLRHDYENDEGVRIFKNDSAWQKYPNTKRLLDKNNTEFLRYWIQRQFMVRIHQLASDSVFVRFTSENKLVVLNFDKSEYLFALSLNQDFIPFEFYRPTSSTEKIDLSLKDWREVNNYMLPFYQETFDARYIDSIQELEIY